MSLSRSRSGFTLIELLVVITIIGIIGGALAIGIPRYFRSANRSASQQRLKALYASFIDYNDLFKRLPDRSGPGFSLQLWDSKIIDHTTKDAEMFFCPSTNNVPAEDLSNLDEDGIDWTGPDLEGLKQRRINLSFAMRNANARPIVCNRVPEASQDLDPDQLPHSGMGIAVLYLGGATEFLPNAKFEADYPIIGPDSPLENFHWMVPDRY